MCVTWRKGRWYTSHFKRWCCFWGPRGCLKLDARKEPQLPRKKAPSPSTMRREYDEEFKAEAVQMLLDGHSATSIAERLGITNTNLLYKWKQKFLKEAGPVTETLDTRVRELELELQRVPRGKKCHPQNFVSALFSGILDWRSRLWVLGQATAFPRGILAVPVPGRSRRQSGMESGRVLAKTPITQKHQTRMTQTGGARSSAVWVAAIGPRNTTNMAYFPRKPSLLKKRWVAPFPWHLSPYARPRAGI